MIDLYYILLLLVGFFLGFVKFVGLFIFILFNWICNDVELRIFNLCVCEGWDSLIINDFFKILIVEFVVGEFNNFVFV